MLHNGLEEQKSVNWYYRYRSGRGEVPNALNKKTASSRCRFLNPPHRLLPSSPCAPIGIPVCPHSPWIKKDRNQINRVQLFRQQKAQSFGFHSRRKEHASGNPRQPGSPETTFPFVLLFCLDCISSVGIPARVDAWSWQDGRWGLSRRFTRDYVACRGFGNDCHADPYRLRLFAWHHHTCCLAIYSAHNAYPCL